MASLSSSAHVPSSRSIALIALVLASGCAAGSPSEVTDGESEALVASSVVVADSRATIAAEVLGDRVVLPLAVADRYRALSAGAIFVGARGAATGKNPDGFLRRVVAVSEDAGSLIVTTTRASLTDAIVQGAVRTSSAGPTIDGDGLGAQSLTTLTRKELSGIAIDFADKPIFDGVDEVEFDGKKARFAESITLQHAAFSAKPVVDVDLRIRDGKVTRFTAKVEGNLDTSVRATATVTSEGDLDPAILAELRSRKHVVKRVLYQSPRVALPNLAVGGVPISPSVQLTVTLRCQLAFGGPIVAHAGVEAKSAVRLGASWDGAAWSPPVRSAFTITPSFTLDRGGEIDARCAIEADAELSAYGDSGITMSVAPYVDFGVKADGAAHHFTVDAGAEGSMRGRADVFGVRPEDLDRKLVDWKAPALLEGTGP
ncbi:hypothetical protein BH11MYX4_BH11MYX4_64250 [soil metagenome]